MQVHVVMPVGVIQRQARGSIGLELRPDFGFQLAPHSWKKEETKSSLREPC